MIQWTKEKNLQLKIPKPQNPKTPKPQDVVDCL